MIFVYKGFFPLIFSLAQVHEKELANLFLSTQKAFKIKIITIRMPLSFRTDAPLTRNNVRSFSFFLFLFLLACLLLPFHLNIQGEAREKKIVLCYTNTYCSSRWFKAQDNVTEYFRFSFFLLLILPSLCIAIFINSRTRKEKKYRLRCCIFRFLRLSWQFFFLASVKEAFKTAKRM